MNPSDKDLDRLFREASDRFEPDDSILSWSRLEKNLSGQLPERPPGPARRFGFRPLVWVPAAMVIGALSFFLVKNHQSYRSISTLPSLTRTVLVSPAPAAGAIPVLPSTGKPPDALLKSETETATKHSGNKPATTNAKNTAPNSVAATRDAGFLTESNTRRRAGTTDRSEGTIPNRVAARRKADRTKTENTGKNATGNETLTGSESLKGNKKLKGNETLAEDEKLAGNKTLNGNETSNGDETLTGNKTADGNETSNGDETLSGNKTLNGNKTSDGNEKASVAETREITGDSKRSGNTAGVSSGNRRPEFAAIRLPSPFHSAAPAISGNDATLALMAATKKELSLPAGGVQVRQPLTIGLVMGPDYTDGGVSNNQLGNSVGLAISYYLTNRLSVNTGLLYGVKTYSARGRDFQPRPDPLRAFGSYPRFESANGTVTLFEIPLSLRYDFPVDSKTRLFLNAGLSSYLPLKETFTTYFHDQGRVYGWRHINHSPGSHWFAIGHFSGGIERDLGKGLSFQVEPYFNLPFTNVCTGNVKLNTYGLLLSVRFTPVLSRKKG